MGQEACWGDKVTKLKKLGPVLLLIGLGLLFYWKVLIKDLVPFPGDLMVGAYLPWLEYKWGYGVGVPIKNPLISDVFSQLFIWRHLAVEAIRSGEWPLWNPYSYSGYPLLSNFQSGTLYLPNLLMLVLGMVKGWGGLMIFQVLGMSLFMYWFLQELGKSKTGSILGALVYAFSGFSICWSQFATASQAMIWLPFSLLLVEKYITGGEKKWLWWLPLAWLLLVTAGHFQAVVYSALVVGGYGLFRLFGEKKLRMANWGYLLLVIGLSAGLVAIQVLPTIDLAKRSVRFGEGYIEGYNFGLLPISNLITLFAPDYFGNPVRRNFWGFFNYHETIFYIGMAGLLAVIVGLFEYKRLKKQSKFFVILAVLSLLLGFDTPLGRMVYQLKVPGLSTSAAGRVAMIWTLSGAVLSAELVERIKKEKLLVVSKWWAVLAGIGLVGVGVTGWARMMLISSSEMVGQWIPITRSALRNLVVPVGLMLGMGGLLLVRKRKIFAWGLILLTVMDLFWWGWRYLPMVRPEFVFPSTEVLDWMDDQEGWFRTGREQAELLTPNTWTMYGLFSPSGYDPMAVANYVSQYEQRLNGSSETKNLSRYSELRRYDAKSLGQFGVKYLLAVKRNEREEIKGDNITYKIDESEWKRVKETEAVAILENEYWQPMVALISEGIGKVEVEEKTANRVKIAYESSGKGKVIVRQSWDPGWRARVNGEESRVEPYDGLWQQVEIEEGKGEIGLYYLPDSFVWGRSITGLSLLIWLGGLFKIYLKKKQKTV